MRITYSPDHGFEWPETLLANEAVRAVYEERGQAGVYYVFAFGKTVSVHSTEFDLVERDRRVIDELDVRKLDGGKKGRKFAPGFYEDPLYKEALREINRMKLIPDDERLESLRASEQKYLGLLSGEAWSTNVKDVGKNIENDMALFKLLKEVRAEIRTEEKHLQALTSKSGMTSLNDLFD